LRALLLRSTHQAICWPAFSRYHRGRMQRRMEAAELRHAPLVVDVIRQTEGNRRASHHQANHDNSDCADPLQLLNSKPRQEMLSKTTVRWGLNQILWNLYLTNRLNLSFFTIGHIRSATRKREHPYPCRAENAGLQPRASIMLAHAIRGNSAQNEFRAHIPIFGNRFVL
jgi:hypothetical protein